MLRFLIFLFLAMAISLPAHAKKDGRREKNRDQDEIYDARRSGSIIPLSGILEKLGAQGITNILEIESDYDDGIQIYEIYYLDSSGRRREVEVDATNGRILEHDDGD